MTAALHLVDVDDLWPRDDDHRYRLYALRGEDDLTVLAAAPDLAGIGAAIGQLHDDAKTVGGTLGDDGATGILDVLNREWVVIPWRRARR